MDEQTILLERDGVLLVRLDSVVEMGGKRYNAWRHEIWTDRGKFENGTVDEWIDGEQLIYCTGLSGYDDAAASDLFNRRFLFHLDGVNGFKQLTADQKELFSRIYDRHMNSFGTQARQKYTIDHLEQIQWDMKDKCLRVYFDNGDWWHYDPNGTWY